MKVCRAFHTIWTQKLKTAYRTSPQLAVGQGRSFVTECDIRYGKLGNAIPALQLKHTEYD